MAESVVRQSVVLFRTLMTRRANALTGHVIVSPFRSWWMQTPFQPFFWLSSFNVALCAARRSASDADRGNCRRIPFLLVLKNVMSSILNCTVRFELFRVALVVYSPTRNK